MKISPGSILWVAFPFDDGKATKNRPALVLGVEETLNGVRVVVAYGSTQKVSRDGYLPHELVLWEGREFKKAGLREPTRFDLSRRTSLPLGDIKGEVGNLPADKDVWRRLRRACVAAA